MKCVKTDCKFPKTCSWNQKCMQKELELSIKDKKIIQSKLPKKTTELKKITDDDFSN